MGPYSGRLDNGGEEILLRNNSDRIMDIMNYNDAGDWPVGPDGSGATLAKRSGHLASGDAFNWTTSLQVGGTPGADNFPPYDPTPVNQTLLDWDTAVAYADQGTDLGTAWRDLGFDDSAWSTATGIFQAGDPHFPPDNVGGLAEPGEGLYAYWPLDESSGTVAPNLVAGGVEGSLQRSPRWASDPDRGQVLTLDGINDHVIAGELPALAVNDDFTWSLWFKQDQARSDTAVIAGNRDGGQQDPLQFVKLTPTNFEYYSGAADPNLAYTLDNDRWYHLAVVKSGAELTYYVNGEVVATGVTQHDTAASPFYLGGDPNVAGEYADGQIDDVAMWTRDLPAETIQGLADGTFSPLTAPTVFLDGPIIPEGLPTDRVDLAAAANTYYFRYEFTFDDDPCRLN